VHEPALVGLTQRRRDADGQAQQLTRLHGHAQRAVEGLTARVLEHKHRPVALAHQIQRPHRPIAVELIPQSVFMRQSIEAGGCGVLRYGDYGEPRARVALGAPPPAQDALAVVRQYLQSRKGLHEDNASGH